MIMNLKMGSKSSHRIIVAWSGVVALCLYGIPAFGLAAADADDQGAVHFNQGETGTITFTIDLDGPQSATPYYIIRIDPNNRPFCVNGLIDESFALPDKFSVNSVKSGQQFHVRLLIDSICVQDQGVYILEVIPFNTDPKRKRQKVTVLVPPGPADCYQRISSYEKKWVETHCEAKSGNIESIISCFQNGNRIPYIGEITDNGVTIRGEFRYTTSFPVRCCSHPASDSIGDESCRDYSWPPVLAHTTDQPTKTNQRDHSDDQIDMITSKVSHSDLSSGQKSVQNVQLVTMIFPLIITLFY